MNRRRASHAPSAWIKTGDNLVAAIEDYLLQPKTANPVTKRMAGSFRPKWTAEFDVFSSPGKPISRLTEWRNTEGKVYIVLAAHDSSYRKAHYNTGYHHNPNGRNVPPPHHIHFPTESIPDLSATSTYAHPFASPNTVDYLSAFKLFCAYSNIKWHGLTMPLL